MPKWFLPAAGLCAAMFAVSPILIANAPYESTMGLVQKIFYYHVPSAISMLLMAIVCGVASLRFIFTGSEKQDRLAFATAELVVVLGLIVLATGPLWARKAWGIWWPWDVRVTSTLVGWMMGIAYLLVRRYGGPGSEKLAAGLALFGLANAPFVYLSVNYWRTIHPATSVVPTLPSSMGMPFWFCFVAFLLLCVVLVRMRIVLQEQRAAVDALHLALED